MGYFSRIAWVSAWTGNRCALHFDKSNSRFLDRYAQTQRRGNFYARISSLVTVPLFNRSYHIPIPRYRRPNQPSLSADRTKRRWNDGQDMRPSESLVRHALHTTTPFSRRTYITAHSFHASRTPAQLHLPLPPLPFNLLFSSLRLLPACPASVPSSFQARSTSASASSPTRPSRPRDVSASVSIRRGQSTVQRLHTVVQHLPTQCRIPLPFLAEAVKGRPAGLTSAVQPLPHQTHPRACRAGRV